MSGEARPPFGKSGSAPASGDAPSPGGVDPSMEDILASIRRILNEEDAVPPPGGAAAPAEPEEEEPLALSEDMLVSEPKLQPAAPQPIAPQPITQAPIAPQPIAQAPAAPEPLAQAPGPAPTPPPAPAATTAEGLLAPAAAAAATASLGTLLKTVAQERTAAVSRNGPTIEDVVREAIRPMLKEWLDQHLPPLVERLVRAEIERVVGRALS